MSGAVSRVAVQRNTARQGISVRRVFWSLSKGGATSGVDLELRRLQLYDDLEKSGRKRSMPI